MKRFVALLILCAFLSFNITASADLFDDFFDYTSLVYEEGSFSSDIVLSSDTDFEFLNAFEDSLKPYSLKSIVSGFANSKIHIDADYSTERDQIFKGYFRITTSSPLKLNDGLSLEANAVFQLWVNMNFVNTKMPYYKITLKTPMSDQYYVFCSSDEKAILFYPKNSRTNQILSTIRDALRTYAIIGYENGGYRISVNDVKLKSIIEHLTENSFNELYLIANGTGKDTKKYEAQKQALPSLMHRLKYINVVGKKGISQKFMFDENKKLHNSDLNINIDTNIFSLYYAITGEAIPSEYTGHQPIITAKNSNIKFSININTTYSNKFKDFYYPKPVKSLITNVFEGEEYSMDYTTSKETMSPYETISVISPGFTTIIDGTPYIPLRNMLNSLGVHNESIFWIDGDVEIYEEIASVLPFKRITMTENSKNLTCDGLPVTLSAPVLCIDHIMYVPEDFVNKVLDATILGYNTTYNYYTESYYTTIDIERLKPVYYIHLKNSSVSIIN